jgi:D-beta-D-heptose 7-phosphate kinase/D-beta-D-heptose 1-phosphate adenosyltransferase
MDIQQLKSSKILVIGDSCTDKYHFGACTRLSPEAPVPIFKLIKTKNTPGMAGNTHQNLINLGNEVEIITNKKKITKERFVDLASKQHIMRLDTGENKKVIPFRGHEKINIKHYDCIVISDYNKGFLDHQAIESIVDAAIKEDVVIFVDSKRRDLSCYRRCFLKVNENEFNNIKQMPQDSELIITMGRAGAKYQDKIYNSFPSDVDNTGLPPNVCGAGDTFLSGLVTHYMTENNIDAAINFANRCASVAVKNFGTYAVGLDDIK